MAEGRALSKCLCPPTLEVSKSGKEIPTRERQALSTQPRLVSAGRLTRRWGNLELEPCTLPVVICHLLSSEPPSGPLATLRLWAAPAWPPGFPLTHQLSFSFQIFLLRQGNTPSLNRAAKIIAPSMRACGLTQETTRTELISHS